MIELIRDLLQNLFLSEAEKDRQGEPANLVDALFALARAIDRLANTQEKKR